MARALVRQLVPLEMAILGAIEFAFLLAMTFALLTANAATAPRDCFGLAATLAATVAVMAMMIGLYRPEVCLDRGRFPLCAAIAAMLAFPALLAVSGAFDMAFSSATIAGLATLLAIWLPFVLLVRFAFSVYFPRFAVPRRVLVIGDGPRAARLRQRLAAGGRTRYETVAYQDQSPESLARCAGTRGVTAIVVTDPDTVASDTLFDSKLRGIPVWNDISFQERHLGRIELETVDANWLLFAEGFNNDLLFRAFKRVFDISVALILAIITLPLALCTALLIKLDTPGPVLYRQERTGLHGRPFTVLKFRSMTANAETPGQAQWARQRDPRVTRVGAFIRACRIDELPQLFNVLHGEMSLIGPRPERPVFVAELAKVIPFYDHRHYVKPGLTGWAQVNYPYGASIEDAREKLAYDLYYIKNRGVLLDLVILISTVRVVLFGEGAR